MTTQKITELQLKQLNFHFVEEYKHDQYYTRRYKKNCLEVQFTYEGDELLTCELTISELNFMQVAFNEIKKIDKLLGHHSE